MAHRLRQRQALDELFAMDADLIGTEGPTDGRDAVAAVRAQARAAAVPERAIVDRAALVVGAAYRMRDGRRA